jgi:ubiquinone/menaquinone biosynthesis C-methylase UbiE
MQLEDSLSDVNELFDDSQSKTDFIDPTEILLESGLAEDMIVADLGCGSGFMSFAASKIVGNGGVVYAVDIRRDVLGHVESQVRVFGQRNVTTVEADLMEVGSTGIAENSVDIVVLAKIVYQLPSPGPAFEEAHRILKPGGKVLILEWIKEGREFGPSKKKAISADEMKKIVRESDFLIEKELGNDDYHYAFLLKERA